MGYAMNLLVTIYPQFGAAQRLPALFAQVDIGAITSTVRFYTARISVTVQNAFIVGIVLGWVAVTVSATLTCRAVPSIGLAIRRGQRTVQPRVSRVEAYIALHAVHYAVLHQLVTWAVAVVFAALSINPLVRWIVGVIGAAIVASIASVVVQMVLQKVLVEWFLTDGVYTIIRPEMYSMWHYVGLVLGIFTAPLKCIARVVTASMLVVLSMAQLEYALFPEAFFMLDAVRTGFISVIAIEANNSNPLYVAVISAVLLRHRLRRVANASNREMGNVDAPVTYDELALESTLSSCVRNTIRICLGHPTDGTDKAAPLPISPAIRRPLRAECASQRLWEQLILLRHQHLVHARMIDSNS